MLRKKHTQQTVPFSSAIFIAIKTLKKSDLVKKKNLIKKKTLKVTVKVVKIQK